MPNPPTLKRSFEAGLLFGVNDNERILLQVCSDFDVAKRQLDSEFGLSRRLLGPFEEAMSASLDRARSWTLSSEKTFNKAFEAYFRQYKKPEDVRHRPTIHQLVLIPFDLDTPLLPNDVKDK